MASRFVPFLDLDLTAHDIQALNDADALVAFFGKLGYHTNARIIQTAANLGMAAEAVVRPIRRIERIANHEDALQVYLFEVASVTATHTRALARAFRNLVGNYLLVLASDYESVDFVLLERYVPKEHTHGLGQRQVGIRPRLLTVDRRKPSRLQLRVLRRFTWTEPDPFFQYDKLLAAYAVADWSEEFFNNRALFSDYYLKERLPLCSEWSDDPKPSYIQLRDLYLGAPGRFAGQKKLLLHDLVEPVLHALGFEAKPEKNGARSVIEPDYRLFSTSGSESPIAECLVYPWGRSLDGKDDRDQETKSENPGAVVVSLLERDGTPWVIVTNGNLWRLYSQRTHSRATNYYEIDLNEMLAESGPQAASPGESFRYFWLLFRRRALEPAEIQREGKTVRLSFLDRLLLESEDYAKELGDRLKGRVFEQIFPHLAAGFIQHLRQNGESNLSQLVLDRIFEGTLTLLYRLLFLLYAESRDLLPVREFRGYFESSLTNLKKIIADAAGAIVDEVGAHLKKHYRDDSYELYERLSRLFRIIDKGDAALNVPVYNGGLFLSDPASDDTSPEAKASRFLQSTKVPDRFLAHAIDLLARDVDSKRHDLISIDYKSLGVRQLGSIYEGLLEFKLRIAEEKLAIISEKNREIYIPVGKLTPRDKERVERQDRIVKRGEPYLENDKRERKASASYYTPDHIVKYIVAEAVGHVLRRKFEDMRPRLRDAQKWHREMTTLARAKKESVEKYESGPAVENKWRDLVESLFDIKVLDPAMGSGHFLVETVDFVTDKTLVFLNAFPWNPVVSHLTGMREAILDQMEDQGVIINIDRLTLVNLLKRHVLKRCIYGVDLNPMAVELAKVSLWLDCFTLGAPLSFLDHHFRCGNSLIGVSVEQVRHALEGRPGEHTQLELFGSRFAGLLLATDLMRRVGQLADVTSAQVRESRAKFRQAADALAPFKRVLDVYVSQWFGNGDQGQQKRSGSKESPAVAFLKSREVEVFISARTAEELKKALEAISPEHRAVTEAALQALDNKRFLHWELEFPEVFYGPSGGFSQHIVRKESAGFDVVIGNPPYDVLASEELGYDVSDNVRFFKSVAAYAPAIRGKNNLYKLFICRGTSLLDSQGWFSFIVPMGLLGDDPASGVRRHLIDVCHLQVIEAFPQKDDARNRIFAEAKLATAVFVTSPSSPESHFVVRTHPGRTLEDVSAILTVNRSDLAAFDEKNLVIPTCTERDWTLALRIIRSKAVRRIRDYCGASQGEVNETTDGKRGFISTDPKAGPQILRGSSICMYVVREASQGRSIFLKKELFLDGKPDSNKARHHQRERVGWQESSAQNNFRRIIAAKIPAGEFCNHKINYIPADDSKLPLDFVLAILNTKLSDWFFRLASSSAAVSHYQIHSLPAPKVEKGKVTIEWEELLREDRWNHAADALGKCLKEVGVMPEPVMEAISTLSQRIQHVESHRVLKNRSARSQLAPEAQPIQDAIDAVLFKCYGLTPEEGDYISRRLEEML